MTGTTAKDIDEYIAGFPEDTRAILEKVRATIRKAAPKAGEAIKYNIPTYVLNGNLVSFAAYKKHIGLYPAPRQAEEFKKELANYKGNKSTAQFPLDKPMPLKLITRIIKFLVKKNAEKVKAKVKSKG